MNYNPQNVLRMLLDQAISYRKIKGVLTSAANLSTQIIKPVSSDTSLFSHLTKSSSDNSTISQILTSAANLSTQIIKPVGRTSLSDAAASMSRKISTDMLRQILLNASNLTKSVITKPIYVPQKVTLDLIKNILTNASKLTSDLINRSKTLPKIKANEQANEQATKRDGAPGQPFITSSRQTKYSDLSKLLGLERLGEKFTAGVLGQLNSLYSDENKSEYEITYSTGRINSNNADSIDNSFHYTGDGKRLNGDVVDKSFNWQNTSAPNPSTPPPSTAASLVSAAASLVPAAASLGPNPKLAENADSNTIIDILTLSSQLINLITEEHDVIQEVFKKSSELVNQIVI